MGNLQNTMELMLKNIEKSKKDALSSIGDSTKRAEIAKLFAEAEGAITDPSKYDFNKFGIGLVEKAKTILKMVILVSFLNFSTAIAQDSTTIQKVEKPKTEKKKKMSTGDAIVIGLGFGLAAFSAILVVAAFSIKSR